MNYPPDHEGAITLFKRLQELDEQNDFGTAEERYNIIHDLAEAHFYEATDYFIKGLENSDPDYRWYCISALATHWQVKSPDFIQKLLFLAEHDDDIVVRDIAIDSLGYLSVKEGVSVLRQIIINTQEPLDIRQSASYAFLRTINYINENRGVNWRNINWISIAISHLENPNTN